MSRILFCEDDVTIHKLIRMALRGSEHEVMMATDGAQGLKMAKEQRPVVIFTDVAMPVMTGFELADALRADPELAGIPIVFITASLQRSEVDDAMRHGGAKVIGKPFIIA